MPVAVHEQHGQDDRLEKEEDARRAHEGWTRVKDTRRFRLPDEEGFRPGGVWKPPRFVHRQKKAIDLLRHVT